MDYWIVPGPYDPLGPPVHCREYRRQPTSGDYQYRRLQGYTKEEYRKARKERNKRARKARRITMISNKNRRRAYAAANRG